MNSELSLMKTSLMQLRSLIEYGEEGIKGMDNQINEIKCKKIPFWLVFENLIKTRNQESY